MINKSQETFQPIESNSKLKSYFCPHCQKLLMKGDVKNLSMICPSCNKLVKADGNDLLENND